ncbi:A1pp-domain-containing protein [Hyaloscypha variabilis F]|uniref:A1pp-domain-containing protein n=1 Tax=Hyaloscypha variabilis (strain UAMH 11265 / GT02V1 / F) TaxID=1149755 RepID=A0A2J6S004_HYAVF|nr:A1pp-domain-containing protein [Hyaloscypha variabilis F]
MVSPNTPLKGDPGTLLLRSPDSRLEIRRATPSTFPTHALVHATNSSMTLTTTTLHSTPLIHTAGSELRAHLRYNHPSGLKTGDALFSPSFELQNCYYIIHVNGPDFHRRGRRRRCIPLLKQQLADCYRRALEEAFRLGIRSVAFPCVGTGRLGWPRGEAARIAVGVVRGWLRHRIHGGKRRSVIGKVVFLAESVRRQVQLEAGWCAAFREFWPQVSTPRRASFLDYVDRQEQRRLERDTNQLVESQGTVRVIPTLELSNPVVMRELRRSRRIRKKPERYGQWYKK